MFEKLKKQIKDDPITAIAIASGAVYSLAKLIDAVTAAQGRRAYAKQIDFKIKHSK